ncbi:helix-turn-helix domain-containing protein, partial [Micromonospora tarensis]|nr:Hin recombinase [Micromonospora tarensis]
RTGGKRRRPGRPRALGREQVEAARRMHAAGTHSVDAIAATLGVSRATVYRHLASK